jgi:hypothetical protein
METLKNRSLSSLLEELVNLQINMLQDVVSVEKKHKYESLKAEIDYREDLYLGAEGSLIQRIDIYSGKRK